MKKAKRLTKDNSSIFAAMLTIWSWNHQSYFLHEFYEAFGMNINTFYKHLYKAIKDIPSFKYDEVKQNLMKNRRIREEKEKQKVVNIENLNFLTDIN